MTTSRSQPNRPGPQLIPRRVLRSTQIHHPAVLDEARRRSEDFQLRLADRITTFAGVNELCLSSCAAIRSVDAGAGKKARGPR